MRTAVEWLTHIFYANEGIMKSEWLEQAKQMDMEQKQSDYMRGWNDGYQNKVKNPFNDNPKSE